MKLIPVILGILFTLVPAFAGTNSVIVVSATRLDDLDLMAVDTAADVSVIDHSAVEQSGAASVPELLQKEANVLVRNTSGSGQDGQTSMRGFGENSHLRVLVLVDGHKINPPDMGGINWQRIPVSNIERVEVIRGGQNVLYGNHAMSGVIKITTRRCGENAVRAGATMGSFGYRAGRVEADLVAGNAELRVGANAYFYDGFRSNSTSRASTVDASCGYYLNDTDVLTLRTSAGQNYAELPGPLNYDQMMDDPTQAPSYDGYTESWDALGTLLYEAERDWGAGRINAGVSYVDRDVSMHRFSNWHDKQLFGASIGPRARFGDDETFFMGGADLFYDTLDNKNYLTEQRAIVKGEGEFWRLTAAPYLFAQKTIEEKTIVSGGVRFEYAGTDNLYTEYVENQLPPIIDTPFGPRPNPDYKNPPDVRDDLSFDDYVEKYGWAAECSVTRLVSDELSVWTGYDRVYRYPTLDEAAAYQGYPLSDPLNKDLDPENGHNFEAGVTFEGQQWMWSTTAFCMLMDDEIAYVEIPTPTETIKLNSNIGSTARLGSEVELACARRWWGASTRWSFVDARFDGGDYDGNRVPLVPWASGTTLVWAELIPEIRFTMIHTFVSGQYQGGDDANSLRMMDPYSLLGFRMNVLLGKNASLMMSADNLTDEVYASSAYYGAFYPGSGRSYRVGIKMEF